MSLELRTPLNAVLGFAQLMRDEIAGPVSVAHKEYMDYVLTSGRHLLRVIKDVLDLAGLESEKLRYRCAPANLPKMVSELFNTVRPLADLKRHELRMDIDPRCADLVNDPVMLNLMVYNYLSNAIKFTPDGGRVTIRATPDDPGMVRIEAAPGGRVFFVALPQIFEARS